MNETALNETSLHKNERNWTLLERTQLNLATLDERTLAENFSTPCPLMHPHRTIRHKNRK